MNYDFYINGKFQHFTDQTYDVLAPSDQSVLATIPDASAEDVNQGVAAAQEAYQREWKRFDPAKKEAIFQRWAASLEKHASKIGQIAGRESGSGDRTGGVLGEQVAMIRYYAGFISQNYGDVLELNDAHLNYVVREPLGVVAAMVPWNSAVGGAIQKLAPALVAGNTVVLRCPDEAPLAVLLLAHTIEEAGFPRGVVNIIAGSGPVSGQALVSHSDVRLISFTGSVPVGQAIKQAAAKTMKRTVLELGGKSPFIVFADADLDKAADSAMATAYGYQGQVCCATTRVLVEESIEDEFIALLRQRVEKQVPAYPEDNVDNSYGPLFNEKQYKQVERYVEMGKKDGKLLWGGQRHKEGKFAKGFYYQPTAFLFEDDSPLVCQEEIFGPVLSIIPFRETEEAIRVANAVPFGLASTVWTRDIRKANTLTRALEAGTVWVNGCYQWTVHAPWGGFKSSGMGREYGKYALEPYSDYKNVWLNG